MRMRNARSLRLAAGIVCLGASALVSGQQAVPVGTGIILGKVLDVETGAPLPGVLVELGPGPSALPGQSTVPRGLRVLTDAEGRYVFRQLPPMTYSIRVTTGGSGFEPSGFLVSGFGHLIAPYLNGGYGQRRPNGPLRGVTLGPDEVMADAVIRLWKSGAIEGMVIDEAGDPLVGFVVSAVRRTSDGVITTGPSTRTDDRGMYRVSGLVPGEYVVAVPQTQVLMPVMSVEAAYAPTPDPLLARMYAATGAPTPTQTGIVVGDVIALSTGPAASNVLLSPAGGATRHVYQSTFHPSATTLALAAPVTVSSGVELTGVDVRLLPVPATSVSGVILDGTAPVANFGVRLMPADTGDGSEVLDLAHTATDAQGRFTFPTVPVGQYRVFAQRLTAVPSGVTPAGAVTYAEPRTLSETAGAWAAAVVSVGDRPVNDVLLNLKSSYRVRGRVVFEGGTPRPPSERLAQFAITAVPTRAARRESPADPRSMVDAADLIAISTLTPGRFVLKWPDSLAGWSVESVVIGARNVTDAAFEVTDADVADAVITFTDRPAEITGTVRLPSGGGDSDVTVFLFPTDRSRWRDAAISTRLVRSGRVDAKGTFRFTSAIPGEYHIVAVSEGQAHTWPDQRFLAQLGPLATTVRVSPHQSQSVSLSISEVR